MSIDAKGLLTDSLGHKEEKFVTIDFETWERKYKPMEYELERTKRELESKSIELYIGHSMFSSEPFFRRVIATIDMRSPWGLKDFDADAVVREIKNKIGDRLIEGKDIQEVFAKTKTLNERIDNIPAIVRWLFKIKSPK
jgi:hypothetical protein